MTEAVRYLFARGARNIRADLGANVGTVLAVGLAVAIPLVFGLAAINLGRVVDTFIGEVEMVAYVSVDADAARIETARAAAAAMPGVHEVRVVTSEQALARFGAEMPEVNDLVRELGENPLPPSLEITLDADFRDVAALADLAQRVARLPGIIDVDDGRQWVERLGRLIGYMWIVTIVFGVFLLGAASLLMVNTIRLAIFRRREEIGVYRLVGATNPFIRGPLLIEGVFQGTVGALVGLAIAYGLYRYVRFRLADVQGVNAWLIGGVDPHWFDPPTLVAVALGGGLIGLAAAALSTRRFLRV